MSLSSLIVCLLTFPGSLDAETPPAASSDGSITTKSTTPKLATDPASASAQEKPAGLDPRYPDTLQAVLGLLESEDKADRDSAYEQLRRLDQKLTGPIVAPYLSSPQPETRRITLRLVRSLEYEGSYARIARLLTKDTDPLVRREASHAITALHPQSAIRHLEVAAKMDRDLKVRRAAILDLGELETLKSIEVLHELYLDVRHNADPYLLKIILRGLTIATGKSFGDKPEIWAGYVQTLRSHESESTFTGNTEDDD